MTILILNNSLMLFHCASHCWNSPQALHRSKRGEREAQSGVKSHQSSGKKPQRSRICTTLWLAGITWEIGCCPEHCLHSSIKGLPWKKTSNFYFFLNLVILLYLYVASKCYRLKVWTMRGTGTCKKSPRGKLKCLGDGKLNRMQTPTQNSIGRE